MKAKRLFVPQMTTALLVVASLAPSAHAYDDVDAVLQVSTMPENQAKALSDAWRNSGNIGMIFLGSDLEETAREFQAILDDPMAVANRLNASYATDAASLDFAGAALAALTDAGYPQKGRRGVPKDLYKSAKEQPEKLTRTVEAILEAIRAPGTPESRLAAAEFLLQVHCETLISLHNMAGHGARFGLVIAPEVTAFAEPMLDDPDPFVQAMAEWAMSVAVCNANDSSRAKAYPPAKGEAPAWFARYLAVPEEYHLPYDYIRQAVSLGMHRRSEDLVKLATDTTRRALARAEWTKANGDGGAIDSAIAALQEAYEALQANSEAEPSTFHRYWLAWRKSVRDVVLQGPDIDFDSMVYIKRFGANAHLQPGVHSGSQFPNGGDIFVQTGLDPANELRSLGVAKQLKGGFGHDLDLHWDAGRIVFSWKRGDSNIQKLYEINLDGSDLTQVTDGPYDDVDPAYLPDDEVVFGSTRGDVAIMCHGSSGLDSLRPDGASATFGGLHTNIFRTLNDHTDVLRLSFCKDDDAYPHILNDGRIVYMRWDYQERGVNELFTLWVINPDGTGADGYHKVHIPHFPETKTIQALRDTRAIPESRLLVSAGGGHYNYAEGTVILGDPSEGINNPDSLKNITPFASPVMYGWGNLAPVPEGGVPYVGGYYAKPWPLSEKSFLVSATYDQPLSNNFQLYYIDVWGNKELIHRDKLYEVMSAAPIERRKRPPVLADRRNDNLAHATLYMDDVYADLPGVEKGEVKYLRILQMIHWIKRAGERGVQWHPNANASEDFAFGTGGPVRSVGIVPVSKDGSAFFEVPAEADIYFQALDKDYRAVQRMRTHVEFAPGEIRGCIGCHETKTDAINAQGMGEALATMKPVRPTPPAWGDQTFISFEKHIQPVFDANCVECHDGRAENGWLDLTAKRDQWGFMQGYRALYGLTAEDPTPDIYWTPTGEIDRRQHKKLGIPKNHDHPWWKAMYEGVLVRSDDTMGAVTEPKQFGAIQHPMGKILSEDPNHRKLLTEREMELLMTFFDVQAPYFDTFRQQAGRKEPLKQVRLVPYAPFEKDRQHTILDDPPTAQMNP